MSAEVWLAGGAIVSALVAGFATFFTARHASRRMAKIEEAKQDATKADQHHKVTQDLIDNLRFEVERLKNRATELSSALEKEQADNAELRRLVRELTETANNLRFQIQVLQQRISKEGL